MASTPTQLRPAEPHAGATRLFGRVLVGFEGSDGFDDALTLARRLVDPESGTIRVCGPLDGRHERVSAAQADAVVAPSAPHGPAGRIGVDRRLLRLLHRTCVPVAVAPAGHRETGRFHRIGVAVDDSPEAAAALACAYALAARDGSAVALVRATPVVAEGLGLMSEREQLHERLAVQERLDLATELAPAGVNPHARLLHGDPATVLPKAFDGLVDLVVCGSRGNGTFQRAVSGSVSTALLDRATQPVLVVRTNRTHRP
jgi:nucleotide-binding universal stress UspA family protein